MDNLLGKNEEIIDDVRDISSGDMAAPRRPWNVPVITRLEMKRTLFAGGSQADPPNGTT